MQFRNRPERAQVCMTLLALIERPHLWSQSGPTETATALLLHSGSSLSPGERVLFLAAYACWDGTNELRFAELALLSPQNLHAIGTLLVALAADLDTPPGETPHAVIGWLDTRGHLIEETWRDTATRDPQAKLEELANQWGMSVEELLQAYAIDSVVPGICSTLGCSYSTEYEADQAAGWCEECQAPTVVSAMVLGGIL